MRRMSKKQDQSFIEKCYKDSEGKVVVFQSPNVPIMGWLVFTLAARIFPTGTAHELSTILAFGSLFVWGWLELFYGVNYLRRLLGLLILVVSVLNKI